MVAMMMILSASELRNGGSRGLCEFWRTHPLDISGRFSIGCFLLLVGMNFLRCGGTLPHAVRGGSEESSLVVVEYFQLVPLCRRTSRIPASSSLAFLLPVVVVRSRLKLIANREWPNFQNLPFHSVPGLSELPDD
jgi:hypothetical protein